MRIVTMALAAALSVLAIASCGSRSGKKSASDPATETKVAQTCFTAIDEYLSTVIGSQYAPGEVCIPSQRIIAVDDSNPDDIQVWGDFWVDNFNVVGDTLMSVSGGSHPGRIHVKKNSEGNFFVTGLDAVGDGSSFLPTAKEIFGERFDEFQKVNSDQTGREEARKKAIAYYVSSHSLPVKLYKDYGWPAVAIPDACDAIESK